jgi:ribosomal protein S18 acetylase RimI-like enzyme
MRLSMRPATPEDGEWLAALHESVMGARPRERSEPDVRVVSVDDVDVGAVWLSEDDDGSMRIGLIEVQPSSQSQGIGTAVIRALDEEAARAGSALTLRVRHGNRARGLYDRLGFVVESEDDTHAYMRRS